MNDKSKIIDANERFCTVLGYSYEEIVNRSFDEILLKNQ
ncbi:hypothetical protein B5G52_16160 [Pseudoalteromonas sp. A601]|nr:hypothetical protein B5G52_16160 [Pseudoalteromonas sp. A601]